MKIAPQRPPVPRAWRYVNMAALVGMSLWSAYLLWFTPDLSMVGRVAIYGIILWCLMTLWQHIKGAQKEGTR